MGLQITEALSASGPSGSAGAPSGAHRGASPVMWAQSGPDDVVDVRAADVVGEMRAVPGDDVLAEDRLAVAVLVDLDLSADDRLVVDLVGVVAQEPYVALSVGVAGRGAVVVARHDVIAAPGALVRDPPAAVVAGVAQPHDLGRLRVPVLATHYRRVVELADDVAAGGLDVEVQAP